MNMPLRYLSVCSGIEAASVAWEPLGWRPVAFSEIDAFPSAVLSHHYPSVPNWGDMTRFKEWPDAAVDLLVGGTPCQSFSVAGLRKGLDDPRGNLALVYLGLVDRYRPKWVVWENVPGVLSSSNGRDFGAFLGGLGELGYGWAYRVLDAQYIRTRRFSGAVPQRRRRVFVVGYLGDWRPPAAVLFDPESLRGNPPPRREPGQGPARGFETGPHGGGWAEVAPTLDTRCKDGQIRNQLGAGVIQQGFGGGNTSGPIDVPACLTAKGQRIDFEVETMVAQAYAIQERAVSENPNAGPGGAGWRGDGAAYTLEARTVPQAVAFDSKGSQVQIGDLGATPTLRAMGHAGSHANAGGQLAVAFAENSRAEIRLCGGDGQVAAQLTTGGGKPGQGQPVIATRWAVRRLTPLECERLQGFPDGYTDVPYRKRNWTPDGPRYKALGNSMAVNAMDWIGQRIDHVRALIYGEAWTP